MKKIFIIFGLIIICCGLYASNTTQQETPEDKKTQVVIVGTIHKAHNKNPNYNSEILKQIIISLKPDAILNELPLSQVDPSGRPVERLRNKEVSPECWAADIAATELDLKQIPFDRPDRQENFKKTNYFERQKRSNKLSNKWGKQINKDAPNSIDLKITQLWAYAGQAEAHLIINSTPEIINSEAHDSAIRIKHSLWYDIMPAILQKYPGYETLIDDYHFVRDQWFQRNKIMAENIIKTAKEYLGQRLVVVTGATHRYVLRDFLAKEKSIELKEYWEITKDDAAKTEKHKPAKQKVDNQISRVELKEKVK